MVSLVIHFFGLRPGEWVFYFDTSFNFPLCHPKGAHSLGHRFGQLDTSGAKFNFPLWYSKGAHSLGHHLGQWGTSGAKFNFPLWYPKGAHSLGHHLGQLDTSGAKGKVHEKTSSQAPRCAS